MFSPGRAEPNLLDVLMQGLERRRFLNWEQMLACSTNRAMGNASDGTPLDARYPPRNPWLDGWADVLDIINSHAQACVCLSSVWLYCVACT